MLLLSTSIYSSLLRSDEVTLPFGVLTGNLNGYGAEFLGIPFAARPERFEPPVPCTAMVPNFSTGPVEPIASSAVLALAAGTANFTNGRRDATAFSPRCPQKPSTRHAGAPPPQPMDEDCLFLNVYTPHPQGETGPLPIMFWIHGGGLETGSAMEYYYNASRLAAEQRVILCAMLTAPPSPLRPSRPRWRSPRRPLRRARSARS